MTGPLCIVVKGFPRVSETFIARELEALHDRGLSFSIAALRRPGPDAATTQYKVPQRPNYLPEYLHEEPARVWRGLVAARAYLGFTRAWKSFRADFARDRSRNRIRRFGQACVLAAELPVSARHLHAHFIHTPASVARYAAIIRGLTFSVSAHAKDIWTAPDWDLREKLDQAIFTCVCNEAGAERLSVLSPSKPPALWPHLTHRAGISPSETKQGSTQIRMLTVARAVPKKGLEILLEALARLPAEPAWTWTHIGGGDLLPALKRIAHSHPYKDRLALLGAQPHAVVTEALRSHDVFVLTAKVSGDGDRDGRPNALIEAMSAGLACVATNAGGIPEVLRNDAGLLTGAHPRQIAETLTGLMRAPSLIQALGLAAAKRAAELDVEGAAAFERLHDALRKASGQ